MGLPEGLPEPVLEMLKKMCDLRRPKFTCYWEEGPMGIPWDEWSSDDSDLEHFETLLKRRGSPDYFSIQR